MAIGSDDTEDGNDDFIVSEEDAIDHYLEDIKEWRKETFSDTQELDVPTSIKMTPKNLLTGFRLLGMSAFDTIKTTKGKDGDKGNDNNLLIDNTTKSKCALP